MPRPPVASARPSANSSVRACPRRRPPARARAGRPHPRRGHSRGPGRICSSGCRRAAAGASRRRACARSARGAPGRDVRPRAERARALGDADALGPQAASRARREPLARLAELPSLRLSRRSAPRRGRASTASSRARSSAGAPKARGARAGGTALRMRSSSARLLRMSAGAEPGGGEVEALALRPRRARRARAAPGRPSADPLGAARRARSTASACRRARSATAATSSARTGTTISAAPVGVGARMSAAWSMSVQSVSWPTAETSGMALSAAARTTTSSLKPHRSSIEPPPRATMSTSGRGIAPPGASALKPRIAAATSAAAGLALDAHRPDQDTARKAVVEAVQDVADDRAGRRGDDADRPAADRAAGACARRRTGPRRRACGGAPRAAPSARRCRPARAVSTTIW